MGLFGSSKIRATPVQFASIQLNRIFSKEFIEAETRGFATLSGQIPALRDVPLATYLRERQHVVCALLKIAWDRNVPYAIFIQFSSIISDDPRVQAITTGVYAGALSKAQQAQLPTLVYIASVFVAQLLAQGAELPDDQISPLLNALSENLAGLYVSFEALIKQYKFVM